MSKKLSYEVDKYNMILQNMWSALCNFVCDIILNRKLNYNWGPSYKSIIAW